VDHDEEEEEEEQGGAGGEDKGKKRKLSVSLSEDVKVEGEGDGELKTPRSSNASDPNFDPNDTEWRYKKEIESLSGQKRQRKQVATFQPSFLNDRRMLEEQAKMSPGLRKTSSQDSSDSLSRRQSKRDERLGGRTTMKFEWWMEDIKEGTQVEANWQNLGGFYPGRIHKLNDRKRFLNIHYDDGDVEREVEADNVRVIITHEQKKEFMKRKSKLKREEDAAEKEKKKAEQEKKAMERERKEVEAAKKAKRDAVKKQKLQEAKR
jgi:hypothetical protein